MNRGGSKKNLIWKKTAVTGAILAAMAAPLVMMPTRATADLASAVDSGSHGPVVTIVSPQYADVVKGTSVSIDVAVQQRTNPVKALQMFVDDHMATPGWVPIKSLQSSKFNWDSTVFANGPHKLTVRVSDAAGLIGQAEITVYVNNTSQSQQQETSAPDLKWIGVQNSEVLKGVVNLQLQASANFGVKYIFVMLNSVSDPDKKPALRSWMINQPPYIIPFDTTKVNDGAYVMDALAYDALSNQGEASRLNIAIANNTINPTYIGSDAPSPANNVPNSTDDTPKIADANSPDNTNTTATNTTPPSTSSPTNTNTTVASAQIAPLVVPFQAGAPTTIPQPSRDGALHDNNNNYDNGNSLMVEVQSSAQVQPAAPAAQPRVTDLPIRYASNDAPAQLATSVAIANTPPVATLAQPSLFASSNEIPASFSLSLNNEQPLTTIAETKLSSLPNIVKPQTLAAETAPPVREAKLPVFPTLNTTTAVDNSMRQSQPISTFVNTHSPDAILAQTKFEQVAPQRFFQVNDALSMPLNNAKIAPIKTVSANLPVFPHASLNSGSAKASDKSTFTAPTVGMTSANVSSRMAQATPGSHVAARLMTNAQIGILPGYVALKPVPVSHQIISGEPLVTAPNISIAASDRIASTNTSGKSWGYQHNTPRASGKSTKPQIAFLPKFNSKPKANSFASITVSPVSTKRQVSHMSQSWPAIYQAKQHERLAAIAERYGLPVEVLAKNNGLSKGAILTAGQKIKMPHKLQVSYDGKALHSDVSPLLVGTTGVAAFRFLFEQQGGKVSWNPKTHTVHARNGNSEVTLTIGSDQAVVNQKTVMMDLAAFLLSGRTMVPVRLFEKSLNAQVTWDPSTGRMFMAMAG